MAVFIAFVKTRSMNVFGSVVRRLPASISAICSSYHVISLVKRKMAAFAVSST